MKFNIENIQDYIKLNGNGYLEELISLNTTSFFEPVKFAKILPNFNTNFVMDMKNIMNFSRSLILGNVDFITDFGELKAIDKYDSDVIRRSSMNWILKKYGKMMIITGRIHNGTEIIYLCKDEKTEEYYFSNLIRNAVDIHDIYNEDDTNTLDMIYNKIYEQLKDASNIDMNLNHDWQITLIKERLNLQIHGALTNTISGYDFEFVVSTTEDDNLKIDFAPYAPFYNELNIYELETILPEDMEKIIRATGFTCIPICWLGFEDVQLFQLFSNRIVMVDYDAAFIKFNGLFYLVKLPSILIYHYMNIRFENLGKEYNDELVRIFDEESCKDDSKSYLAHFTKDEFEIIKSLNSEIKERNIYMDGKFILEFMKIKNDIGELHDGVNIYYKTNINTINPFGVLSCSDRMLDNDFITDLLVYKAMESVGKTCFKLF